MPVLPETPLRIHLDIQPGIGPEGFIIRSSEPGNITVTGNDDRGLLYGIGKLAARNAVLYPIAAGCAVADRIRAGDAGQRDVFRHALSQFLPRCAPGRGDALHRRTGIVGVQRSSGVV